MANELLFNVALTYTKNNVTVAESIDKLQATVTGNGLNALAAYTATTSSTALPLGSVAVAGGWLYVKNTDATNYVKLQTAASGTEFSRIFPGEFALLRLAPGLTAPAVQANTASCVLTYCVFDL